MKHLLALLVISVCAKLWASDTTQLRCIFDDFYQPDQVVEVTLQFDAQKLVRTKLKKEKFPGTIIYQNAQGDTVTRSLHVESRGKLRLEICDFPPLKLDFGKKELQKEGMSSEFDELKLITHCNRTGKNDILVLKEWLVYKLYNIITDKSLRAQLLHIRYLDLDGNLYADETAFMIEPAEALAYRLGCQKQTKISKDPPILEEESYEQMILFQYMIGNVDWRIREMHNIELLKDTILETQIAVAYDFDYAGMVDAFYAVHDERAGQKFFGERVLNGTFSSEASFQKVIALYLSKEAAILQTCADFTLLEEKERQKVMKYLSSFFEQIKKPKLTSQKLNSY